MGKIDNILLDHFIEGWMKITVCFIKRTVVCGTNSIIIEYFLAFFFQIILKGPRHTDLFVEISGKGQFSFCIFTRLL